MIVFVLYKVIREDPIEAITIIININSTTIIAEIAVIEEITTTRIRIIIQVVLATNLEEDIIRIGVVQGLLDHTEIASRVGITIVIEGEFLFVT